MANSENTYRSAVRRHGFGQTRGRRLRTWALIMVSPIIVSCVSYRGDSQSANNGSVIEICKPDAKVRVRDRLDNAIALLSRNDFCHARAEIVDYIGHNHRSGAAITLLFATETDPQAYWGEESFEYTVKRGDSLTVLSERYLGDMLLFPMLGRYNEVSANGLRAQSRIRIPNGPKATSQMCVAAPKTVELVPPTDKEIRKASQLVAKGDELNTAGDYVGAYDAYAEATTINGQSIDAHMRLFEVSGTAADVYHRKAIQAILDQKPQQAITHWNRVLEIIPSHPHAPTGLRRAQDIVSKIAKLEQ